MAKREYQVTVTIGVETDRDPPSAEELDAFAADLRERLDGVTTVQVDVEESSR